jgi:DNA-binding NarL/FixJ family response regulator
MAAKLSNDELAQRVRQRMKRGSAAYRDRLSRSGQRQTLVWLPEPIRAQLDGLAETRNESLSAVTTELLTAALTPSTPEPSQQPRAGARFQTSTPEPTTPTTTPVMTTAERDARILELHRQGVGIREIARRLNLGKSTVGDILRRMEKTT